MNTNVHETNRRNRVGGHFGNALLTDVITTAGNQRKEADL